MALIDRRGREERARADRRIAARTRSGTADGVPALLLPAPRPTSSRGVGPSSSLSSTRPSCSSRSRPQIAEIAIPGLDSPLLQFVRPQNEEDRALGSSSIRPTPGWTTTPKRDAAPDRSVLTSSKIDSDAHARRAVIFGWGQGFPGRRDRRQISRPGTTSAASSMSCAQHFHALRPPTARRCERSEREPARVQDARRPGRAAQPDDRPTSPVVRREDRRHALRKIAYEAYSDPTAWRPIAAANEILDPTVLEPGTVLAPARGDAAMTAALPIYRQRHVRPDLQGEGPAARRAAGECCATSF